MNTPDEIAQGGLVLVSAGLGGFVGVVFLLRALGRLFSVANGRAS